MDWDKYSQLFEWETNEINPYQNLDKQYYLDYLRCGDFSNILELGAGSGRVTIPLLIAGYNVTALDYSQKMLEKLDFAYSKFTNGGELRLCNSDMSNFTINNNFDICLVTYSSFQHLMSNELRLQCLRKIYEHLKLGGQLILDLDPGIMDLPYQQEEILLYNIYNEELNADIEMYSSWEIDLDNMVKNWNDRYVIKGRNGEQGVLYNHIALKYLSLDQIKQMLETVGFTFLKVHGGFHRENYNEESMRMIVTAEKS